MSHLFDYRDAGAPPPGLIRLDTLAETHGPDPAHLLADPDCPLILAIGPARYVSREDLAWFVHRRAEEALARRRSGRALEPCVAEMMDASRKAAGAGAVAVEDRFYVPNGASRNTATPAAAEQETEPVTA